MRTLAVPVLLLLLVLINSSAAQTNSKDAYVQSHAGTWVIGTGEVEMTIRLDGHGLAMTSFRNKLSRTEYMKAGAVSDETRFGLDGKEITGANGGWSLVRQEQHELTQGEVQLDLTLGNEQVEVTKYYVAYPGTVLIRSGAITAALVPGEQETYRALGGFSATQGEQEWRYAQSLDGESFLPMVWGAGGYEGRWTGYGLAQIGRIWMQPGATADVARVFVSPANGTISIAGDIRKDPSSRNGNAVEVRVLLNDRQIWPASGWQEISADYENPASLRLDAIRVETGDAVRFVIRHTGRSDADPVIWDPVITVEKERLVSGSCSPAAESRPIF